MTDGNKEPKREESVLKLEQVQHQNNNKISLLNDAALALTPDDLEFGALSVDAGGTLSTAFSLMESTEFGYAMCRLLRIETTVQITV